MKVSINFTYCRTILLCLALLCCISCTVPETDSTGVLQTPITPKVDLVPSIRTREAPKILAINYMRTIGRTGQAAGEFLMPMGIVLDAYQQLYVADAGNNKNTSD